MRTSFMLESPLNKTFRAFLAFVAFAAFGATVAHAQVPGAGISFPMITKVERQLNLTPEQRVQYDVALNATKAAFVSIEASHKALKEFAEIELANDRPNLDLVVAELDDAIDANRIDSRKARAEWLKLYAMLSAEQVAIVKSALQDKLKLVSWIREFVVKWFVVRRG